MNSPTSAAAAAPRKFQVRACREALRNRPSRRRLVSRPGNRCSLEMTTSKGTSSMRPPRAPAAVAEARRLFVASTRRAVGEGVDEVFALPVPGHPVTGW